MADFAIIKAAIEGDFPDWMVWRSDAGRWYATRAGNLTDQQLLSGYAMTVAADNADSLRGLLSEQAHPGEGAG
jgi:hypothetical protein